MIASSMHQPVDEFEDEPAADDEPVITYEPVMAECETEDEATLEAAESNEHVDAITATSDDYDGIQVVPAADPMIDDDSDAEDDLVAVAEADEDDAIGLKMDLEEISSDDETLEEVSAGDEGGLSPALSNATDLDSETTATIEDDRDEPAAAEKGEEDASNVVEFPTTSQDEARPARRGGGVAAALVGAGAIAAALTVAPQFLPMDAWQNYPPVQDLLQQLSQIKQFFA